MIFPRRGRPGLGAWWVLSLGLLIGGVTVLFVGRALVGGVIMGLAFVAAAVLRLLLPDERAGGLAVRSRTWDVLMLLTFAVVVFGAFLAVDLRPRR
ncbi:Protein of unknown function [Austwickia chelonae]|uniref:DUF3017 domain-containing protein n=1 Tax=Austwickia chelonae NBRC 105200 TaxID=1184607 RepID=K6V3W5_9MICO|nr:DUF3017 domain-containing protein [Austwickia chelonae]GAB76813.1 hypothetical protein AUCHE_03_00300 [Austwickia chelonae NBRC 105200]SEW31044.1 Protein of unknown function [Austwickia chelonae]